MKKTVKKLYKGSVEVINTNKHFEIVFCGESMILSSEDLVSKRKFISKTFKSKIGGKNYKLYGYEWNPNPSI